MEVTAKELAQLALRRMERFTTDPQYGSAKAVVTEVAARSGVSFGGVQKFYRGERPNPTVEFLDKILTALRQMQLDSAA